jgi:heat shock protein HslJ
VIGGIVIVVALAACGDDGGGEADPTTTSASPSTTLTPAPATSGGGGDETPDADDGGDEAPELAGVEWSVINLASESTNSVTNVWPDTEITLKFDEDGTISGNAGCNDYQGTYEVTGPYVAEPAFDEESGQLMEIVGLSWTEMACEDDNLMEQETEYLDDLQRVEYWSKGQGFGSEDSLLLRSEEDGLLVEAVPAS